MTPSNPAAAPAKPGLFNARAVILLAILVVACGVWASRAHVHFDWRTLGSQLRSVSPTEIIIGCLICYACMFLRAWRWAVLLRPIRKTSAAKMFGPQLIGFALVGMFGRVADLARPYLIARRTQTTVATQLAIYSIERAFDLGAAAILFSVTLAFAPRNMPHHEAFARAGAVSLAATAFLAGFAIALRLAGARVADFAERMLKPVSPSFAAKARDLVLSFSEGLRIVSSIGEFSAALALSLLMWLGIASAYIACAHAFHASPVLAHLSIAATMLMLATSMGGSLVQLPVVGWFTQIALLAAALHGFFGVPLETATAWSTVVLIVLNLILIPGGLVAARMEGMSLMDAARVPAQETV